MVWGALCDGQDWLLEWGWAYSHLAIRGKRVAESSASWCECPSWKEKTTWSSISTSWPRLCFLKISQIYSWGRNYMVKTHSRSRSRSWILRRGQIDPPWFKWWKSCRKPWQTRRDQSNENDSKTKLNVSYDSGACTFLRWFRSSPLKLGLPAGPSRQWAAGGGVHNPRWKLESQMLPLKAGLSYAWRKKFWKELRKTADKETCFLARKP